MPRDPGVAMGLTRVWVFMRTSFRQVVLVFIMAVPMLAGAYHISPTDPVSAWWENTGGVGNLILICESNGPADPVNPQPIATAGSGGLCYATSQHLATTEEVEAKKSDGQAWSSVTPVCIDSGDPAIGCFSPPCIEEIDPESEECEEVVSDPDWIARVGNNAHRCEGRWTQSFVYKELLAYFAGIGMEPTTSASGHVTFVVNTPATVGTYISAKDVDPPEISCSESNSVGLQDRAEPDCWSRVHDPGAQAATASYKCTDRRKCSRAVAGTLPYVVTVTCERANACRPQDKVFTKVRLSEADGMNSWVKSDVKCGTSSVFQAPAEAKGPATPFAEKTDSVDKVQKNATGTWKCIMTFRVNAEPYYGEAWCMDP